MIQIKSNPARSSIDELFESAIVGNQTWLDSFHAIGSLPGIALIDDTTYTDDRGCDWFVFHNEEWYAELRAQHAYSLIRTLYELLPGLGYEEIPVPQNGDIVAYLAKFSSSSKPRFRFESKHFGIFKDGKVTSKFYYGPVYEHNIEAVPTYLGDIAAFFRKQNT